MESIEEKLRSAFQKLDEMFALLGVPFRPAWAQPLHDGWQKVCAVDRENQRLVAEVAELREQLATARAALTRIEKWHGEFPPTGRAWNDDKPISADNTEMSYGACNGSNGERDYMRAVARAALP